MVDRARSAEQRMDTLLGGAFDSLGNAMARMGRNAVAQTAAAVSVESRVSVSSRRVMGVVLPNVQISVGELSPSFSPGETSQWVDEASLRFRDVLKALAALAETKVSLKRLAMEVKKTIRRVNALEKIALPDFDDSLKYITDVLEGMEREAFFTLKLVKNRLTKRRTESGRR